jgi:hypothetical protein
MELGDMAGQDGLRPRRLVHPAGGQPMGQAGVVFGHGLGSPRALTGCFPNTSTWPSEASSGDGHNYASYFRVQRVDPPHALVRTRANCSPPDVLSHRRHGRPYHGGGAVRVRHRAADRVRGKASLLAKCLDDDFYAPGRRKGD